MVHLRYYATYVYLATVPAWALLHAFFGDRWWWLALLNIVAFYFFVPLPLAVVVAFLHRQRALWAGVILVSIIGFAHYGHLLIPSLPFSSSPTAPTLSVTTYNVLISNNHPQRVVETVRATNADVVLLQELNQPIAEALWQELSEAYPYQIPELQTGKSGMGVISRFPLRPRHDIVLEESWIGRPQLVELLFHNTPVILLNIHATSLGLESQPHLIPTPSDISRTLRKQQHEARLISGFAHTSRSPLIVAGDFNTSELSDSYSLLTQHLSDSWREVGWAGGHTFPGFGFSGTIASHPITVILPLWLIRIDYIFHSDHWNPIAAKVGPWDTTSDHRPLTVHFTFAKHHRR